MGIVAEAGVGFVEVNAQCVDCIDGLSADIIGEQGAVATDGLDSYEDSTVVEDELKVDSHLVPAAPCDIGAAPDPDLQPLLPATFTGVQGSVLTEGSESFEDPYVLEVDPPFLPPDCCDSLSDEVNGEQGAVTIDGVESFEDSSVVEAVISPATTCEFDDALVGELEADHAIVDVLLEPSLVERTAAVLDVLPLLPATIAADGSEGTVICDGFVCYEDPPVVEAVLEGSPLSLPPASCEFGAAKACDLEAVQSFSDRVDDELLVGKVIAADLLDSVSNSIAADLQEVAAEPISAGLHEEPSLEKNAAVSCLIDEQVAGFYVLFPFEPGPSVMLQFSVVNGLRKHHKWRDKSVVLGLLCGTLDEQGLYSFEKLDLLQMLSRLVWTFAATYYEQVYFKIQHKWRDKGC